MITYTIQLLHGDGTPESEPFILEDDPRPYFGEPLWVAGGAYGYDVGDNFRLLVGVDNAAN